ncbi:MAG: hypothetical protein OER04_11865 [Cyclobacteriaceae bacterium]|nr:hypothetical protein [Cyclobacteriaceae bacterium]
MALTYQEISKEIGYVGHVPYPPKERVQTLYESLRDEPTVDDFKTALRIFRFAPEAQTANEAAIIYMLNLGLGSAKKDLYLSRPVWSIRSRLMYHAFKLIPSLALFHTLRITMVDNTIGTF